MEMDYEGVGSYASFVARVGRASSEIREVEGTTGVSFITRGNNIVESSSDDDENMFDETTILVEQGQSGENEETLLADKTTLVIPPDEIRGFLRDAGINSRRTRKMIKVKKENGQFLCPVCEHPFEGRTNAASHTYSHMNPEELGRTNIYYQRCPHSPQRIFFDRQHYANHINSHLGIKNFKCHICQKGFGQKRHLENHILTHLSQGPLEVQTPIRHIPCYFCHKKLGSMSELIRHTGVHTKEKPFKCSYCNKWFAQLSHMTSHIRHVHSHPDDPKPFPCPQCPKRWKDKGVLYRHIKEVHGEKLHHCSTCPKSFASKWSLNIHVNSIHRKIRQQCPQCDKTYSDKSHLTRHIKNDH